MTELKFTLKPSGQRVKLNIETTTIGSIFPGHSVSITKNGPPLGTDNTLLKSCQLVNGDFLWKIPKQDNMEQKIESKSTFVTSDFDIFKNLTSELPKIISSIDDSIKIENSIASKKSCTVEVTVDDLEITILISKVGGNCVNCILTINDFTENFKFDLNNSTLPQLEYKLKSVLSNYLSTPLAGILTLPNKILNQIVLNLNTPDIYQILLTCKRLNSTITDYTWKQLIKKHYGQNCNKSTFKNIYKKFYVEEYENKIQKRKKESKPPPLSPPIIHPDNPFPSINNPFSIPINHHGPTYPLNRPPIPIIGGRYDLDPFANPPNTGLQFNPRGNPNIYGPGSSNFSRPGLGRGLGSDDDVYTNPFNPLANDNPGFGDLRSNSSRSNRSNRDYI